MLIGTFNKILNYQTGIYADHHARFHESLRDADAVVSIGYGFGDKAINARVIAWMTRPRQKPRMVVIDPAARPLAPNARGALRNIWARWEEGGAVVSLAKPIEDVTWPEIRALLG